MNLYDVAMFDGGHDFHFTTNMFHVGTVHLIFSYRLDRHLKVQNIYVNKSCKVQNRTPVEKTELALTGYLFMINLK